MALSDSPKCVSIVFPSWSSWRRRNFLGKHFTFLASAEVLQPKPGCSVQSLFLGLGFLLLASQPSSIRWSDTRLDRQQLHIDLYFSLKEESSAPFSGLTRHDRLWCGWIRSASQGSSFLSLRRRHVMVPWQRQDKHVGDKVSGITFVSDSPSWLISHLSRSGISWTSCASSSKDPLISQIQEAWTNKTSMNEGWWKKNKWEG